jgi:hypothetical protein
MLRVVHLQRLYRIDEGACETMQPPAVDGMMGRG